MPLYEMHSMAKEKRDSVRDNCSNDLPFIPENDIVELVWENGQIIMQSQSCRGRKSERYSNSATLPPHETKARAKDIGNVSNLRNVKFGNVDSVFGESPFSAPNGELGLNEAENDDVFPWLNYPPIERSLHHVYGSDILPEISGVTVNETFSQNMVPSIANKCSSKQGHMDFHFGSFHDHVHTEEGHVSKVSITASKGPATSNVKSVQFYPSSSQQCQKSLPISASVVTDIVNNSTSNTSHLSVSRESTEIPTPVNVPIAMKMQKQSPASLRENNSSMINFSHFAQTAALFSANFQNSFAEAHSGASAHDKIGNKDKAAVAINSSPTESTLVPSTSGSKKDANSHGEPTPKPSMVDSKPSKPSNLDAKPPQTSSVGDVIMRNNGSNESPVESSNKGQVNGEKPVELVRASSSICSGNIAERVTDGPKANMKRKCHDSEDSECCSEDVEAESERVKRMAPRCSNGSKRSRAAEVHNLSERRRRDKINEKMRALQELIPNCNKVDKASMLDEAIEYMKTLQLQVQIMSMGAGLYIPSMMLPTGMQHINPAHLAHFMPMGVGMGVGYGMNMLDMSGRSSGCPMVQFPAMQGAHFTSSTIPGPQSLHGMPGSNLQMFGHPGQGFPMPMPQAHSIPASRGCHDNSCIGLNGHGMAGQLGNFGTNFNPSSRDPVQNTNSKVTRNTVANQCETPNVDVAQTTLMQNDSQALDAKQSGAIPSVNSNGKVT